MAIDDYTHPRVTPEEKQPSGLVRTVKEHRLGLWGTIGVIAIGTAGFLLSGKNTYDSTPAQNRRQQGETSTQAPTTIAKRIPYMDFQLYRSPKDEWTGMKITIDTMMIEEWAKYAPVTITIPELRYSAPFPVEKHASSAETTFPSPVPSSGTYHYIIFGKDPATGNAKELYRHVLAPQK
jgi:hypothetical protein